MTSDGAGISNACIIFSTVSARKRLACMFVKYSTRVNSSVGPSVHLISSTRPYIVRTRMLARSSSSVVVDPAASWLRGVVLPAAPSMAEQHSGRQRSREQSPLPHRTEQPRSSPSSPEQRSKGSNLPGGGPSTLATALPSLAHRLECLL